jgi:AcrR family transcriptional regulator
MNIETPIAEANRRQRLIRAAHEILEAGGAEGLTLRAVAAATGAGVSSLYHHFADKQALMAELAIDGFRDMARWIRQGLVEPPGRTPFHAAADAYLGFTRHRPMLYAVMYDEALLSRYASVRPAETEGFKTFAAGMADFGIEAARTEDVALTFWALGRGIAGASAAAGDGGVGARKALVRRVLSGLEGLIGESVKKRGAREA